MDDPNDRIEVKHVCKQFKSHSENNKLGDYLIYRHNRRSARTVLNDISFSVKKGEVLGLIGKNGSGKSTMLKLLTKILRPNSGTIETNGTISCLIELGAGFHPDMTGRENVFINASIFGVPSKVVKERFEDILAFSEIGSHIDERVRNYSSGMYLRLAFAVAINVDADIILVDEILTVGDMRFQDKCLNKLKEFKNNGGTIVLVTHNISQAREMCDKVMWIDDGVAREYGPADEVCDHYETEMRR